MTVDIDALIIPSGVYLLADTVCDLVKVGMATGDVRSRVSALQTASPHPLELLAVVRTLNAPRLENELHWELRALRVRGEWFRWSAAAMVLAARIIETHLEEMASGFVEVTPMGEARGVTLHNIMRQTRHKSERVAMTYIRPATVFNNNPTDGLGDEEPSK